MSDDANLPAKIHKSDLAGVSMSADSLLDKIRPAWKAKSLIERVKKLLPVDPSSACQRLLNAAIHDLREKIILAGLDIANQAALANKLPGVARNEDILDAYNTQNLIDLAYRMGLLSRPEWRRLRRSYEIRRDLEHEDDEYEAQVEDLLYIFKTCIEVVLEKEPVEVIKVTDIKQFVETPQNVTPSAVYLHDYEGAPGVRQLEICSFLVSVSLDPTKPDIMRQNAIEALRKFRAITRNDVKIDLAKRMDERGKRNPLSTVEIKVASAGGFIPYLKQPRVSAFYGDLFAKFEGVGYRWDRHAQHGALLDELEDVGGLGVCPPECRERFIHWLACCFIGEPGGRTSFGNVRHVFYSNVAAPRIERIFKDLGSSIRVELERGQKSKEISEWISDQHIARRFDTLLDLTEPH